MTLSFVILRYLNFELWYILGSSIPVGIAIGRQRQPGTSGVPPSWPPLTSPTGSHAVPPPAGAVPPGATTPLPGPSPGIHNPWMGSPHLPVPGGPIPMGYHLAKDPLTGQILLIPSDPNQPSSNTLWPPQPHNLGVAGSNPGPVPTPPSHLGQPPPSPHPSYGLDRIPPGVLQSHYQQLYLQQQHLR